VITLIKNEHAIRYWSYFCISLWTLEGTGSTSTLDTALKLISLSYLFSPSSLLPVQRENQTASPNLLEGDRLDLNDDAP
jgi:hypothetical protein